MTPRVILLLAIVACLGWALRQAAGRLAPTVAIVPLIFLLSRAPVLIGWLFGSVGMLVLIQTSAAASGKDPSANLPLLIGLCAFCGLGFAALAVGPVWAIARAFAPSPELQLEPGEVQLYEAKANHFMDGEARGGKVLITTRRLGFQPHRFNVQLDSWSMPLDGGRSCAAEGDRFLLIETGEAEGAAHHECFVIERPRAVGAYIERLAKLPEPERAKLNDEALRATGLRS